MTRPAKILGLGILCYTTQSSDRTLLRGNSGSNRKCHEKLVAQMAVVQMPTKYGDFTAYGFVNKLNGEHHVALVKGEIGQGENVLCRVHSECLTGDTFGSLRCDCGEQFSGYMVNGYGKGRFMIVGILLYHLRNFQFLYIFLRHGHTN